MDDREISAPGQIRTTLCRLGLHEWDYGMKELGIGLGSSFTRCCSHCGRLDHDAARRFGEAIWVPYAVLNDDPADKN